MLRHAGIDVIASLHYLYGSTSNEYVQTFIYNLQRVP